MRRGRRREDEDAPDAEPTMDGEEFRDDRRYGRSIDAERTPWTSRMQRTWRTSGTKRTGREGRRRHRVEDVEDAEDGTCRTSRTSWT